MYYLGWESWQLKQKAPRCCNYLSFASPTPPPRGFPSKGAELKCGVEHPRKELSSSHGENVLTLEGSKAHQ